MKAISLSFLVLFFFVEILLATSLPVLKEMKGKVLVQYGKSQAFLSVQPGKKLKVGSRLWLAPKSVAHLVYSDGSMLLINGEARLRIQSDSHNTVVDFEQGEFLLLSKTKKKNNHFYIQTSAAILSAQDALFWGKSDRNKNTSYFCFSGEGEVAAMETLSILKPNQKMFIPFDDDVNDPIETVSGIPDVSVNDFSIDWNLWDLDFFRKEVEP